MAVAKVQVNDGISKYQGHDTATLLIMLEKDFYSVARRIHRHYTGAASWTKVKKYICNEQLGKRNGLGHYLNHDKKAQCTHPEVKKAKNVTKQIILASNNFGAGKKERFRGFYLATLGWTGKVNKSKPFVADLKTRGKNWNIILSPLPYGPSMHRNDDGQTVNVTNYLLWSRYAYMHSSNVTCSVEEAEAIGICGHTGIKSCSSQTAHKNKEQTDMSEHCSQAIAEVNKMVSMLFNPQKFKTLWYVNAGDNQSVKLVPHVHVFVCPQSKGAWQKENPEKAKRGEYITLKSSEKPKK